MLTNNFYNLFADEQNQTNTTYTDGKLKNTTDTSEAYQPSYIYPFSPITSVYPATLSETDGGSDVRSAGLLIGTDGTPPTVNDYKLGNQITNGFTSQTSITKDSNDMARTKKLVAVLSVTNTSSNDLIIKELGYVRGDRSYAFLMDRTVFDTPVVITPGATKTFEYRLNMPTP